MDAIETRPAAEAEADAGAAVDCFLTSAARLAMSHTGVASYPTTAHAEGLPVPVLVHASMVPRACRRWASIAAA